jgi:hypothetical protein
MKRLEGEVLEAIRDPGGDFPDDAGKHRSGRKWARGGGRFAVDPHQFYGLELDTRARCRSRNSSSDRLPEVADQDGRRSARHDPPPGRRAGP